MTPLPLVVVLLAVGGALGAAVRHLLDIRVPRGRGVLLRVSAGRGFRAPTMTELHRPTVYSSTATLPQAGSAAKPRVG